MPSTPFLSKPAFACLTLLASSLPACTSKRPVPQASRSKEKAEKAEKAANSTPLASHYVKPRLVPLDSTQDGKWDLLAIEWNIEPHWHIYWSNPGDSGISTRVTFEGPAKDKLGPVQLPTPIRWVSAGDIEGFGYEKHTAFFAKRGSSLHPKEMIQAKLRWLVCKEECIKGKTTLQLQASEPPAPWTTELNQAFEKLPAPLGDTLASHGWRKTKGGEDELTLRAKQGDIVSFFPLVTPQSLQAQSLEKGILALRYLPKAPHQNPDKHPSTPAKNPQGVFGVRVGKDTTYYQLDLPWPTQ